MTAPRIPEMLLAALFPAGDCRDSVLGDLAEEYAERAGTSGARAAAHWYWAEAARTAPHAAHAWLRGLRYPEAALLIMIAPGMLAVGQLLQYFLMALVVWSWGTVPDSWNILFAAWRDVHEFRPILASAVGDVGWLIPIASGYITARLDRLAPLPGAIAVAVLQVLLIFAVIGVRGSATPLIVASSAWLASTVLGGMLAVWRTAVIDARDAHADIEARIPIR